MRIIIENQAGTPIYQQIVDQVKMAILNGELTAGTQMPSIRGLAKDLRISVITTTRAYHDLEQAGFVQNVQGKGTYVQAQDAELVKEAALRKVEAGLQEALDAATIGGIDIGTMHQMLDDLAEADHE